jgi:hypothetical protein
MFVSLRKVMRLIHCYADGKPFAVQTFSITSVSVILYDPASVGFSPP